MLRRLVVVALVALAPALFAACEKSDEVVLQEQFQESSPRCPTGCAEPQAGCMIKGNVSGQGLKFYIMPGDERYDLAIIEPAKGEAWFCTVQEAGQNGFQPVPPGI